MVVDSVEIELVDILDLIKEFEGIAEKFKVQDFSSICLEQNSPVELEDRRRE